MIIVGAVQRVSRLPTDEFQKSFASVSKPVIITDIVSEWPARSMLTPNAIKDMLGDVMVSVRDSDSEFDYFFGGFKARSIRLGEYVDLISNPEASEGRPPYLGNVPFDDPGASRHMTTLKTLLRFPNYFPQRTYGDLRIWMGGAGQVSTIHNDNYHNLNAQLYGSKTFLLFPPDQYPTLYTQLMNKTCWASPINPHNPDSEKYPLFEHAEALEARLEAGDLLYIPIFWWHQATALTLSINVTMFSFIAETQFWSQA